MVRLSVFSIRMDRNLPTRVHIDTEIISLHTTEQFVEGFSIMAILNETIELALNHYSQLTAQRFEADVFSFVGGIMPERLTSFRAHIEALVAGKSGSGNLLFFLHTPGGVKLLKNSLI